MKIIYQTGVKRVTQLPSAPVGLTDSLFLQEVSASCPGSGREATDKSEVTESRNSTPSDSPHSPRMIDSSKIPQNCQECIALKTRDHSRIPRESVSGAHLLSTPPTASLQTAHSWQPPESLNSYPERGQEMAVCENQASQSR